MVIYIRNRLYGFLILGLQSKMSDWTGWMDGVDTPWTVMTTRAPAVLKIGAEHKLASTR